MADYADVSGVRLALSPGGDETDVESAASLEDPDLEAALDDATDEINTKIAARYTLPFVGDPPPPLPRIAIAIAAYFATLTYRRGDPIDPHDPVQLRYNAAESLLAQIQAGTVTVGTDTADGPDLVPIFPDSANTTLFGVWDDPCGPQYPVAAGYREFYYPTG